MHWIQITCFQLKCSICSNSSVIWKTSLIFIKVKVTGSGSTSLIIAVNATFQLETSENKDASSPSTFADSLSSIHRCHPSPCWPQGKEPILQRVAWMFTEQVYLRRRESLTWKGHKSTVSVKCGSVAWPVLFHGSIYLSPGQPSTMTVIFALSRQMCGPLSAAVSPVSSICLLLVLCSSI